MGLETPIDCGKIKAILAIFPTQLGKQFSNTSVIKGVSISVAIKTKEMLPQIITTSVFVVIGI